MDESFGYMEGLCVFWIEMSSSDLLLWGGIILMAAAAILALVCFMVFGVTGKRLKKKLEQEYGKPER